MRLAVLAGLAAGVLFLPAASSGREGRLPLTPYGQRVHYEQGKTLRFADLDLVYRGQRHVASAVFLNGFDYQDFDVTQGKRTTRITWSSGTGDIGPTLFQRGGHEYALELEMSQWQDPPHGFGPDELMLWKDPKR